ADHHPHSTSFPYTTLFRSRNEDGTDGDESSACAAVAVDEWVECLELGVGDCGSDDGVSVSAGDELGEILDQARHLGRRRRDKFRSEEHTSELQSRFDLVCR